MTVNQLIRRLIDCPQDLEVKFEDHEDTDDEQKLPIREVRIVGTAWDSDDSAYVLLK